LGEADYKEALGEWIDALDSIAAVKATAQASADLNCVLVMNQEQMQTDRLMIRMNEKARRLSRESPTLVVPFGYGV